jgi:hypothetical protein
MQAIEEPVLPLKALDLGAPDQHVRGSNPDAFHRLDDPAKTAFAGLHATDHHRRARGAVPPEQREQMRRLDIGKAGQRFRRVCLHRGHGDRERQQTIG